MAVLRARLRATSCASSSCRVLRPTCPGAGSLLRPSAVGEAGTSTRVSGRPQGKHQTPSTSVVALQYVSTCAAKGACTVSDFRECHSQPKKENTNRGALGSNKLRRFNRKVCACLTSLAATNSCCRSIIIQCTPYPWASRQHRAEPFQQRVCP